ncbi:MAG: hypothetical protein ABI759_05545 [Candidatus Solibacter sp.]
MKNLLVLLALLSTACGKENNVLLGRVEHAVGTHTVVVTDCYRTSSPAPQQLSSTDYHYMPCKDADVWIKAEELTVNGKAYGKLNPGEGVLVDHGVVAIDRKLAR